MDKKVRDVYRNSNFLSIAKMSPWINWLWSKEWINNTYFLNNICKVRLQCTFFYINIYLYTLILRFSGLYLLRCCEGGCVFQKLKCIGDANNLWLLNPFHSSNLFFIDLTLHMMSEAKYPQEKERIHAVRLSVWSYKGSGAKQKTKF